MSLSVVVITKNEEGNIQRCLQSAAWADEIVVVDSGSTDRTVEICRQLGARVMATPDWPGFGRQKNRALAEAKGDWVLSLDADEWVSQSLREEIRAVVAAPGPMVAFRIPRLSSYCGRFMRHSGWWPDRVVRLFKRGCARFSEDIVHERTIVEGPLGTLHEPLLHESLVDLEDVIDTMDRYSSDSARMMHARGQRSSLGKALGHAAWSFLRTYLLRAGFLDGKEGLMLAISNAEGTYYRYAKLMLLGHRAGTEGAVAPRRPR